MRTRVYVVVAIAVVAALSGCGGSSGAAPSTLSWHGCDGSFQCATLSVPVSYSDPGGAQIPIAVVELKASRPNPMADIVLNPGGPGESGVQFLEGDASAFPSLHANFNLISFDPRGVGLSEPLQCLTSAGIRAFLALNPAPKGAKQIGVLVNAAKAFVHGCEKHASTAYLASLSTANTARDMDRLRAALGQKQITYFGFSYGTYLGTLYAELFPKRIRGMVLDGAVDPALDSATTDAEQAAGFETNLRDFFAWCAKDTLNALGCGRLVSPTPAKTYATLLGRFKRGGTEPTHFPRQLAGVRVDYGVALQGVLADLYTPDTWGKLEFALATAKGGDGTDLASSAYALNGLINLVGPPSNIVSANMATDCLDTPTLTLRAHEALARRLAKAAPDFGAAEAWSGLPCLFWPSHAQGKPAPAHAPGTPPLLVVGSTDDPATPYAWAKALASQLPHATLLTRTGAGHTAYRSSSCIRRWVDRYFETLKMPPAGTVCPSDR